MITCAFVRFLRRGHERNTFVFDVQVRLRCKGCNRRAGFRITIFGNRLRGDNSKLLIAAPSVSRRD